MAAEKIVQGLNDAIAFAQGDTSKARVTVYRVGDQVVIRKRDRRFKSGYREVPAVITFVAPTED